MRTVARYGWSKHAIAWVMKFGTPKNKKRTAAFTLAEVLAALLFMAIVIPVAVEALHTASLAGEIGVRKGVAARVADRILNESIVTDRKSTRLNSSHANISYAVFCLKKK